MRLHASSNQGAAQQLIAALCLATDAVGDVVYISGSKIGDYYQVTKVNIDALTTMPGLGVIIGKNAPTQCQVQTAGIVSGVYTGLTPNKCLFVDDTGRLSETVTPHKPTPGQRVLLMMGQVLSASDLLLDVKSPIILTT